MIGLLALALAEGPTLLTPAVPAYPPEAVADRVTGRVVVRLEIAATGEVVAASVVESLRADVDDAALEAARRLRFTPAVQDGAPTASYVDYAFTFALEVADEQGNEVPATLRLHLTDTDGVGVPGAVVTLRNGERTRTFTATADGDLDATFLTPGTWQFSVTRPGFAPMSGEVELGPGELHEAAFTLSPAGPTESIVVIGLRQRWREVARAPRTIVEEPLTGSYQLTRRDVESTPGALEDVTRAVHKLPGVASDGDMLGTFSVRGATSGEVVFLLDRIPLDNPFHLAGFNSIFNPDMLERVDFFANAAPALYPDTTSAVMDVHSWDGSGKDDRHDLDGAIDLSMSGARALLMGPLGKPETPGQPTFALAARRSYIEAYFAVMKAVNLFDTAVAAPEFDELSARLAWRPGNHRLLLTALRTSDHLALVDSEDESIVSIDGSFRLDDTLYLVSLDDTWTFATGELRSTVGYTHDRSEMERDFAGAVARDVRRHAAYARTDLRLDAGRHALHLGALGSYHQYRFEGPVEDTRLLPRWAATPIMDQGFALIELDTPPPSGTVAAYVDHRWTGPVRTRAGVRLTDVLATGEILLSPSAGFSVPLPTATVPKLTAGLYHHVVNDPLLTDAVYGNPDLRAERAWTVVAGVDQGLPLGKGGLARLEGYYARLDSLVVNRDVEVLDAPPYENAGTGHNAGVDLLLAAQLERWSFAGNGSWLHARRTNPLLQTYAQEITPGHAQTWTAGVSAEFQATPRWRFTARYDYHSGRPMSEVEVTGKTTAGLTALNTERLGDFHQLDLRAEWRKATPKLRWSVYLEILNVTYAQSDFLPIVSVEDGVLTESMFKHLPTRPFLGIRADF